MNFAQARFWGLLLAGLAVIGLARAAAWRVPGVRREVFDKVTLIGLGLFLLLCVSRVTFVIFLVVALPQMEGFRWRGSAAAINDGAGWIVLGLFFKLCLADNLSLFFDGTATTNAYLIWLANLLFGLRVYYDFAGYSLIALGLARCLSVKLTLNFLSPYCSTSMGEFWRRWHVTLSQWFRDYVYIPMGGGRAPWWAFNIAVVFVVSGVCRRSTMAGARPWGRRCWRKQPCRICGAGTH